MKTNGAVHNYNTNIREIPVTRAVTTKTINVLLLIMRTMDFSGAGFLMIFLIQMIKDVIPITKSDGRATRIQIAKNIFYFSFLN